MRRAPIYVAVILACCLSVAPSPLSASDSGAPGDFNAEGPEADTEEDILDKLINRLQELMIDREVHERNSFDPGKSWSDGVCCGERG